MVEGWRVSWRRRRVISRRVVGRRREIGLSIIAIVIGRRSRHFCFTAPTRASVDAFHAAVLEAGGRDNGKPGVRAEYDPEYYAAFVVDPDGYRLEAYCG